MPAWKRWLFAALGAAFILCLILLLFLSGDWMVDRYYADDCLDRGGEWDYSQGSCQF